MLEEVRQLYHDDTGGEPLNSGRGSWQVFVLVDEEVLANPSIIKCVGADYKAADFVPKNTRYYGQRYLGWLRMFLCAPFYSVAGTGYHFIWKIAEHTDDEPGVWWDAENA